LERLAIKKPLKFFGKSLSATLYLFETRWTFNPNFFISTPTQKTFSALITPINNKNHVTKMLMGDFFVVLLFYLLLSITATFCFDVTVIQDIYTLNFLLDCKGTISKHGEKQKANI